MGSAGVADTECDQTNNSLLLLQLGHPSVQLIYGFCVSAGVLATPYDKSSPCLVVISTNGEALSSIGPLLQLANSTQFAGTQHLMHRLPSPLAKHQLVS